MKLRNILQGFFGKGVFPHQLWFFLELPGRRLVQPPEQLAQRLRLQPGHRVLELGPGSGFFTVAVASALSQGRLELLDIQPGMFRHVRRKIAKAGVRNVGLAVGDGRRLPYRDDVFNAVFMVTVLGEVGDAEACLGELYRVLAPGGLLSVTEQRPDPDFISQEELDSHAKRLGYIFEERFGTPRSYTAHYRKPRT